MIETVRANVGKVTIFADLTIIFSNSGTKTLFFEFNLKFLIRVWIKRGLIFMALIKMELELMSYPWSVKLKVNCHSIGNKIMIIQKSDVENI